MDLLKNLFKGDKVIPFSLPDIHCRSIQCIKYTDLQEW